MYPFAHIGYALLFAELLTMVYFLIQNKISNMKIQEVYGLKYFSYITLVIAALGPDIIDKLISLPITDHGRYIGHSLLFDLLVCSLVLLLFRTNKRLWLAFILGWQIHLILDVGGFLPILFPFISYDFPVRDKTFLEILAEPSTYINEIIGFLILVTLIYFYFYRGLRLKRFIKTDFSKEFSIKEISE